MGINDSKEPMMDSYEKSNDDEERSPLKEIKKNNLPATNIDDSNVDAILDRDHEPLNTTLLQPTASESKTELPNPKQPAKPRPSILYTFDPLGQKENICSSEADSLKKKQDELLDILKTPSPISIFPYPESTSLDKFDSSESESDLNRTIIFKESEDLSIVKDSIQEAYANIKGDSTQESCGNEKEDSTQESYIGEKGDSTQEPFVNESEVSIATEPIVNDTEADKIIQGQLDNSVEKESNDLSVEQTEEVVVYKSEIYNKSFDFKKSVESTVNQLDEVIERGLHGTLKRKIINGKSEESPEIKRKRIESDKSIKAVVNFGFNSVRGKRRIVNIKFKKAKKTESDVLVEETKLSKFDFTLDKPYKSGDKTVFSFLNKSPVHLSKSITENSSDSDNLIEIDFDTGIVQSSLCGSNISDKDDSANKSGEIDNDSFITKLQHIVNSIKVFKDVSGNKDNSSVDIVTDIVDYLVEKVCITSHIKEEFGNYLESLESQNLVEDICDEIKSYVSFSESKSIVATKGKEIIENNTIFEVNNLGINLNATVIGSLSDVLKNQLNKDGTFDAKRVDGNLDTDTDDSNKLSDIKDKVDLKHYVDLKKDIQNNFKADTNRLQKTNTEIILDIPTIAIYPKCDTEIDFLCSQIDSIVKHKETDLRETDKQATIDLTEIQQAEVESSEVIEKELILEESRTKDASMSSTKNNDQVTLTTTTDNMENVEKKFDKRSEMMETNGITEKLSENKINAQLYQEVVELLSISESEQEKCKALINEQKKDLVLTRQKLNTAESELLNCKQTEVELRTEIQDLKAKIEKLENTTAEDSKHIDMMKKILRDKDDTLADLLQKMSLHKTELSARTLAEQQIKNIMEEYEKTISKLLTENSTLKKDFEVTQQHLSNLENAFSDVHQKYERCKGIVQGYKENEESYKRDIAKNLEMIAAQEKKYETLKSHAMAQLEKSNEELLALKNKYDADSIKFQAQIKRYEVKCVSLTESLEQKTKECERLSAVCDEYIGKT